jgi:parallel beta-helix repeat protein
MKTLAEIETRTAIHASDLPLTISTSGSYYLAENAQSATASISIAANHVTVDLSGFTLGSASEPSAILAPSTIDDVTIRNGQVIGSFQTVNLGLASGVTLDQLEVSGPRVTTGYNARVFASRFASSGGPSFACGAGCIIRDSQFIGGSTSGGVSVGGGSLVTRIVVTGGFGLNVGSHSVVRQSEVSGSEYALRGDTWVSVLECILSSTGEYALDLGDDGQLINSQAVGGASYAARMGARSQVQSVLASGNSIGLIVGDGSQVRDSRFVGGSSNRGALVVGSNSIVVGNTCTDGGLRVGGSGNRIDGNTLVGNEIGLIVTGVGNTIHRNAASKNPGGNYQIASGNDAGPISSAAAATSPWANIEY